MGRLLKIFVYASFFVLISAISKNGDSSSTYKIADDNETNYHQKSTARERTLDFLLAHHFFEISHAIDNQSTTKTYKLKNLFSYVTSDFSGNIKSLDRLFTLNVVDNLFLFKDSHYIFKLRKILI